jgi:hypothetical protein
MKAKAVIIIGAGVVVAGVAAYLLTRQNQSALPSSTVDPNAGSSGGNQPLLPSNTSSPGSASPMQPSAAVSPTQQAAAMQVSKTVSPYEGMLVRGGTTAKVYLIKDGLKEWITSPTVLARLGYTFAQVQSLPVAVVDSIPNGTSLYGLSGYSQRLIA